MEKAKEFELLVEEIYKKLLSNAKDYKVQHDVKIETSYGKRQVDVLITHENAAFKDFKTVIECKNHSRPVDITEIDGFISKLDNMKANKGVFISSSGFTKSFIKKANDAGIEIYTAHQALSDDWRIDFSIPFFVRELKVRSINLNFVIEQQRGDIFCEDSLRCFYEKFFIEGGLLSKWKIKKKLKNGNINGLGKYNYSESNCDYQLKNGKGQERRVKSFSYDIDTESYYYEGDLSNQNDVYCLKDVEKGSKKVIFTSSSFKDYKKNLKKISKESFRERSSAKTIVIDVFIEDDFRGVDFSQCVNDLFIQNNPFLKMNIKKP